MMPHKMHWVRAVVVVIGACFTGWCQSPAPRVHPITSDAPASYTGAPRPIPNNLKPLAAVNQPVVASVNNAADYSLVVAPGSLAVVFGSNLATATASAPSIPLPTVLAGANVSVNGLPAPLLFVSSGQINLQIPYGTQAGAATVQVSSGGLNSATFQFLVTSTAIGIFAYGAGHGIVQNADYSLNSSTNPAASGSTVVVYLTGIGVPTVAVGDGKAAAGSSLSLAQGASSASVGGAAATVQFLGLTPGLVGLAQANITLPNLGTGDYPLIITLTGHQSTSVTISVSGSSAVGFQASSVLSYVGSVAVPNGTGAFLQLGEDGVSGGSVAVLGNYLYVCGTSNINVVDVTNPAAPRVVYEFGDNDLNSGAGYSIVFKGGCTVNQSGTVPLLMVVVDGAYTFAVAYSLANPARPVLLSKFYQSVNLDGITLSGNTAYFLQTHITYSSSTYKLYASVGYVAAADYSNPANPVSLTAEQSGSSAASGTSNVRLDMMLASPTVLYSAASTSTGDPTTGTGALDVFDVSKRGSIVGTTRITVPGTGILVSLSTSGNQLIALGETTSFASPGSLLSGGQVDLPFTGNLTLTFFDITNPASPVMGGNFYFPTLSPDGCRAFPLATGFHALSCSAPDLSATGEGFNGSLYVLDARNPTVGASAYLLGTIQGLGGLAVSNGYLYAATTAGANIYKILMP